jgi:hypothetical protein
MEAARSPELAEGSAAAFDFAVENRFPIPFTCAWQIAG